MLISIDTNEVRDAGKRGLVTITAAWRYSPRRRRAFEKLAERHWQVAETFKERCVSVPAPGWGQLSRVCPQPCDRQAGRIGFMKRNMMAFAR